jgi:hypothetical protein
MRVICRAISSSSMSKKLRLGEYRLRGTLGVGGACANIRSSFFGSADVCVTARARTELSLVCCNREREREERVVVHLLDERLGELLGQRGVAVGGQGELDELVELGHEEGVKVVKARVEPLIEDVDHTELDREHHLLPPLCLAHPRFARGRGHMIPGLIAPHAPTHKRAHTRVR